MVGCKFSFCSAGFSLGSPISLPRGGTSYSGLYREVPPKTGCAFFMLDCTGLLKGKDFVSWSIENDC